MEGSSQRENINHIEYPINEQNLAPKKSNKKLKIIIFALIVVAILLISSLSYFFVAPEMDLITIYDVSKLRRLDVLEEVDFKFMSEEEYRQQVSESIDPIEIEETQKFLESLFLWDSDDNLTEAYLDLYSGQILGYYNSQTKNIVLIEDSGSSVENNVTLAHEFTHALQDQNFDLSNFMGAISTSDAYDARNAVVEGDATRITYEYLFSLSEAEFNEYMWASPGGFIDTVPFVLDETLAFPYVYGTLFINEIYSNGGWYSVDALYENPPASTEQIMHPEKYHENDLPLNVSYPKVPGMTLTNEDTIGEFMIYLMISNFMGESFASDAADGWGGDRYYYYHTFGGS